jgi:hypothetical protein
VHASVGITAASNITTTPKRGHIHSLICFHEIAKVKASEDQRKQVEGMLHHMADRMTSHETRDVAESACQYVVKYVKKVHDCFLLHCNADVLEALSKL